MTSLYDILKAKKGLPVSDSFALLYGRQTGGGGGSDVEYFGAVPFEISAKGTQNAKEYTIYGNTFQNGTPTPEQPVEVKGVGDFDEETGKYKIPVVSNTDREPITTTIYTEQPLFGGDFVEKNDSESVESHRLNKLVLKSSKALSIYTRNGVNGVYFLIRPETIAENDFIAFSHGIKSNFNTKLGMAGGGVSYYWIGILTALGIETLDEFKAWLDEQEANGTPVTMYYKSTTPTEKAVDLPNLQLVNGFNSIDVDTSVKPEAVQIKFKGDVLSQVASLMMLDESTKENEITNGFEESEEIL